tara:strand:+ start:1489 stop:1755 length:267 start_codon:yes stop_codon:yes gene_type:complete
MTANPQFEAFDGLTGEYKSRRMEFPMQYEHCERMTTHINYMINFIRITPYPFVKSLYYTHVRNGEKVLARCIYTDPDNIPDWADDFLK